VLAARLNALLRRAESGTRGSSDPITVDDVQLHNQSRRVYRNADLVELTATEFTVLEILLRNAGQVVNKDTLYLEALGRKQARYDRSLDMHISNIRKKLGFNDTDERIKTIRNVGYLYAR